MAHKLTRFHISNTNREDMEPKWSICSTLVNNQNLRLLYETNDQFLVRVAKKTQKVYSFTFCISRMSKLFHSNFLLEPKNGQVLLKLFVPNLTSFDFGISRSSLYSSRVKRFVILSLKLSFMKLGLISLRVSKISIHNLRQLEKFTVLFPDFFNNQSLCKNRRARLCKFSTLFKDLADDMDQTRGQ